VPASALLPDHAPEAEHAVALLLDQVSVAAPPELSVLGLALNVIAGAKADTVTVADWVAEPPVPVQVSSNSVVLESALVDQVPLVATAPLQPPAAVQAVAFSELQVRLDLPPFATVAGVAPKVTAGVAVVTMISADWEVEPPGPVQVRV
jgi:hypothetical protein